MCFVDRCLPGVDGMIDLEVTTDIDRDPETVFDYLADPYNHTDILPSLTEIGDVSDGDVGKQGRYVYSMLGTTLDGRFEDVTFDRPNARCYELTGGLEGTVEWRLEERDGGTHVVYAARLDLPGPDLLETITDPVARRFLKREADATVENLEMVLEGTAVAPE